VALIHHLGLKREAAVPDKTVRIWEQSGWKAGSLPRRPFRKIVNPPVVEPPAPESGETPTPSQED
jgi:hypothetical protein